MSENKGKRYFHVFTFRLYPVLDALHIYPGKDTLSALLKKLTNFYHSDIQFGYQTTHPQV